jgi:hypothetical protein
VSSLEYQAGSYQNNNNNNDIREKKRTTKFNDKERTTTNKRSKSENKLSKSIYQPIVEQKKIKETNKQTKKLTKEDVCRLNSEK